MKKLPLLIAGIVFLVVGFVHLLRLIYHWEIVIDGQMIPMYVSIIGLIVAVLLALWMFIAAKKS